MGRPVYMLCLLPALTFAILGSVLAQEIGPPPGFGGFVPPAAEVDPVERLAESVSRSIVSLDAKGSRSSEAIANSTVTLGLGDLQNAVDFSIVCQSMGDDLRTFVERLAKLESLVGTVSKASCGGNGSAGNPFQLTFQLHFEGGHNGIFNEDPLLLDVSFPEQDEEEVEGDSPERSSGPRPRPVALQPFRLGVPHTETSHASMALPKSWSPEEIPEAIHADSPFASFDRTFAFTDGKLVTEQKLVIKVENVAANDRANFEKWRDAAKLNESAEVELASTAYYPWSAFTGTTDEGKKAADRMGEANSAIQNKNYAEAEEKLKQAEALDAGHELLHRYKGDLEAACGNYTLALREYQEELKAFPEQALIMEEIADVQERMGRKDDAIATLQRWSIARPDDFYPPLHLMTLYHGMGRDDLAVAVGNSAMLTLSEDGRDSSQFLLAYGREQMLTSQVDGAQGTLLRLLDHTGDIDVVNDAAYYLSEHGVALERIEEAMRTALKQFDPEDEGQTQHLYDMTTKQRTSLLFSSWDTLGWIYFKEGQAGEAESYVRAAWRNHPDPAIGRHLGELLEARDKPKEALDAFYLALETIPRENRAKASTDPDVIAIREGIDQLEKQGHVASIKDAKTELAKLQTLDAGPAGKRRCEADYEIQLTADSIFVSVNHAPNGDGDVERIQALKVPADFFPTGSKANVIKSARLVCHEECTLTLLP